MAVVAISQGPLGPMGQVSNENVERRGSIVAIPRKGKDSKSKVVMSKNIVKRCPQEFLEIITSSLCELMTS